jgi:Uma2 family endonuclease
VGVEIQALVLFAPRQKNSDTIRQQKKKKQFYGIYEYLLFIPYSASFQDALRSQTSDVRRRMMG